jgi:micrococcal nuclease
MKKQKGEIMEKQLYHYKAIVVQVYDGDTCTLDVDLGLNTWIRGEKVRLNRINAQELTGKSKSKGIKSRDYLRSKILGQEVLVQTIKDRKEKYGRYLGEIWLTTKTGKVVNINDEMVKEGYAIYQKY